MDEGTEMILPTYIHFMHLVERKLKMCGVSQNQFTYRTFYRILIWVLQCPSQSFYKIHGHLGVSSLTWYGNYLYSTGRDGTLRHYLMLESESRLESLNADKLQIDWPATTSLSAFGLLVLGFRAVCILKYSLGRCVNKLTDLILSMEMLV